MPRPLKARSEPSFGRATGRAQPAVPVQTLEEARRAAGGCRACPLWRDATQTVFGEGEPRVAIMLVGEQPGDKEDRLGRPFVGPAGRLLDRALAEAGIERERAYVTNAVKHLKFVPRGKRRMHKKPADSEIDACHQWLERELVFVAPRLVVALGATAARALLGRPTPVEANRGRLLPLAENTTVLITVHPSALLRIPEESKARAYRRFVDDLRAARRAIAS